jgi:signal transduction histidine kinase
VARLIHLLSRLIRMPMIAVVTDDRVVYRGLDVSRARSLMGLASLMAVGRTISVINPRALSRVAHNPLVLDGVRFVAGLASHRSDYQSDHRSDHWADDRRVALLVMDVRLRGPLSQVERALLEEFLPLIVSALETEQGNTSTPRHAAQPVPIHSDSSPDPSVQLAEAPGIVLEGLRLQGSRLEGRFRLVESKPASDGAALLERADMSLFEVDANGIITGFLGRPRSVFGLESDAVVGRSVFEVCAEWPGLTLGVNRALEGQTVTSVLRSDPRLSLRVVPVRDGDVVTGAVAVLQPPQDDQISRDPMRYGVINTVSDGAGSPRIPFRHALITGDGSYVDRLRAALANADAALEEAQLDAVNHERLRIARELHDGLGKDVFGLALLLESVAERQHGRAIQAELLGYAEAARRLGNEGRALLQTFRQDATSGLVVRLRALASSLEHSGPVRVQFALPESLPELNPHALHELTRVIEEAFENIHRHAQARHAWVGVRLNDAQLEVSIEDDGRGLPDNMPAGRFGLVGMRERVELLGGHVRVGRGEYGGVRLDVRLPLAGLLEVPDVAEF